MKKLICLLLFSLALVSCRSSSSSLSPTEPAEPTGPSELDPSDGDPQSEVDFPVWDLATLSEIDLESIDHITSLDVLKGHQGWPLYLAFNPDSDILASSGEDGTVRIWDLKLGMEIASLNHKPEGMGVSFHPNGAYLATGGSNKFIRVWDVNTAAQIHQLEGHSQGVLDVAFSPDGATIAGSGRDDSVRIWDVESEQEVFTLHGHDGDIYQIVFHPDGSILASGGLDGIVSIWDTSSGEKVKELMGNEEGVYYVSFNPEGTVLASCGGGLVGRDNSVRLFDVESWEVQATLEDQKSTVIGCEFSKDGALLIFRLQAGKIGAWDHATGKLILEMEVSPLWPPALAIDPDGSLLAVGDQNGDIYLYGIP